MAFIARDSFENALAVADKIDQAVQKLAAFPRYGHRVPELDDENIRELAVHRYRIIYRVDSQRVVVLAAIHGAPRFPGVFSDRS